MLETTTLDNGTRIVTRHMAHRHSTAVGVWLVNGSRHQAPHQSGYAHLLEHLLFKGTQRLDALALATRFEAMGGQVNAHTGKELTALHGLVPNDSAAALISDFLHMLLAPRFDDSDVDVERDVVLQEMAMVKDNPEEYLEERLTERVWPHALGWPILGDPAVVRQADAASVHHYLRDLLRGGRVLVTAAGGIAHGDMVEACKPLAALGRGEAPATATPLFTAAKYHEAAGYAQSALTWIMPTMAADDPRHSTLLIANHVLGGGTSSRLFQDIRERRGLAYDVYSRFELFTDCGLWAVQTACDPERAEECREAVERVTEVLLAKGPEAGELEIAKHYAAANLRMEQDNPESVMERLAREEIYRRRHPSVEEKLAELESVSGEHVAQLLEECWANAAFGMLGSGSH